MAAHDMQHGLADSTYHTGVGGAVENNLASFDASGLLKDSGNSGALPEHQSFWHDESQVTVGNALALTVNIAHVGNFFAAASAAADGDTQELPFLCAAGNYTLKLYCVTSSDSGSLDVEIDGSVVATFDLYSAGTTYNVLKTQATIAIAAGAHTLELVINGKNASSSAYKAQLTQYWLEKE